MPAVDSSTPAAVIFAPGPTTMPAPLISHTWPFAVSVPNSSERLPPVTRSTRIELAPG